MIITKRGWVDAVASGERECSQGRLHACERSRRYDDGADADSQVVWSWHLLLVLSLRRICGPKGVQ